MKNTPAAKGFQSLIRLLNAVLPPILWAVLIFFLSSQHVLPGFNLSIYDFLFKKSAHMFVYAVLYLLTWRALYIIQKRRVTFPWWLPLFICIVYAATDEFHQSFTSGRHPSLRDVGFDTLGASIAFLWWYRYL